MADTAVASSPRSRNALKKCTLEPDQVAGSNGSSSMTPTIFKGGSVPAGCQRAARRTRGRLQIGGAGVRRTPADADKVRPDGVGPVPTRRPEPCILDVPEHGNAERHRIGAEALQLDGFEVGPGDEMCQVAERVRLVVC